VTVAVVDYGMGNLRSVAKALEKAGGVVTVTSDPNLVAKAERVVLPGVGAFGDCRKNLESSGLWEPVREAARKGTPLLGICLGFQLLFDGSDEFGDQKGYGILPGRVVRFPHGMTVPHMGWNDLRRVVDHPLLAGVPDGAYFYFVHSFYPTTADPADLIGETVYGLPFAAMAGRENVVGTQFHPEKSQRWGLRILENFLSW
jgi:glutamine amidotransferase